MTTHDLLSGGDVFGADVSTDAAQSWAPQNQGITNPDLISMSAVAYEPIGPDTSNAEAYALAGRNAGSAGALLVAGSCGTSSWSQFYPRGSGDTPLHVAANGNRPREVGHLLVPLSQTLMVAGANNGLFVFTRSNATAAWCDAGSFCGQSSVLGDSYEIRGIAKDPNDSTNSTIYVSYGPGPNDSVSVLYGLVGLHYSGSGVFTQVGAVHYNMGSTGASDAPHDVVAVKVGSSSFTQVYVALGTRGVRLCNASATLGALSCSGNQYGSLGSDLSKPNPILGEWTSLAAIPDPAGSGSTQGVLLFAGCTADDVDPANKNCPQAATGSPSVYSNIYFINNEGSGDWRPAVTAGNVGYNLLTHSSAVAGQPWWLRFSSPTMLGGSGGSGGYTVSQLLIDPDAAGSDRYLMSVGTGGVWRATISTSGSTVSVGGWQPAANGLPATENWTVASDRQQDVAVGDVDWAGLTSTTNLADTPQPTHATPGATPYATAFTNGQFFFGVGQKDFAPANDPKRYAHVYACDSAPGNSTACGANDPPTPTDLGAPGATTPGGSTSITRVIGLAAGQTSAQSGSAYEVVAATDSSGVWVRSDSNAAWHRITDPQAPPGRLIAGMQPNNYNVSVIWGTGAKYMFIYDSHLHVLFRSPDLTLPGNSNLWTSSGYWQFDPVWNVPAGDAFGTGYVVGDQGQYGQPGAPDTLWASTSIGAFKLTGLDAAAVTQTALKFSSTGQSILVSGPLGIDRPPGATADSLVLARNADQDTGVGLWTTAPGGTTLTNAATPGFLNQAFRMTDVSVAYTGSGPYLRHVYITNKTGGGVLVSPAPTK